MKTTLFLFVLAVSLGAARAQDADYSDNSDYSTDTSAYQEPAVVYNAPVTYAAPVVYNMPVIYNAPVYYGLPTFAMGCAMNACSTFQDSYRGRSTVVYIGGGHVAYQVAPVCNNGSTLVFIGGSWRH
jgi:hypothetical protein